MQDALGALRAIIFVVVPSTNVLLRSVPPFISRFILAGVPEVRCITQQKPAPPPPPGLDVRKNPYLFSNLEARVVGVDFLLVATTASLDHNFGIHPIVLVRLAPN